MPTAAAIKAFAQLQDAKAKELPQNEINEILLKAEHRVNDIIERGHIYDSKVEDKIVRFDVEGKPFHAEFSSAIPLYSES